MRQNSKTEKYVTKCGPIKRLEPYFLYRNDLEKLITDMGIISNRLMPREKIRKMRVWNDLFYCVGRISRGQYDFFRHTLDRIRENEGKYHAVAMHSLGKKVMLIEYPKDAQIESDLKKKLESAGIIVNIAEYRG